jgi:Mn2+/Fe2+ NRAMP family transporter
MSGFELSGVVLLAIILKYPFFEFGPRYAAATGWSLVEGYRRIGTWALWLFFLLMIVSSVIVQAAIVLFTAFLLQHIVGIDWPLTVYGMLVMGGCGLLLWAGRYRILDLTVKVILVLLAVSTVWAGLVSLPRADFSTLALWPDLGPSSAVSMAFILALAGWMPSALDIAVWNSLWTLAKHRDTGSERSLSISLLDFRIGYVGTAILAFVFVLLGATVMFGAGEEFSPQGTAFSVQLVDLYASTLGEWMRPVVLVAVFATMLSTSLTVIDGYPRALDRCVHNILEKEMPESNAPVGRPYWIALVLLAGTTLIIFTVFLGTLTAMVDFATIFTFMTAPILGYLNLRAVTSSDVAPEHRPGKGLLALSYVGLALLGGTAIIYVASFI